MHADKNIAKGNLERPINLTVIFLDYGRKPENPRMHRENMPGFKPGTFLLKGNNATNFPNMQPSTDTTLRKYCICIFSSFSFYILNCHWQQKVEQIQYLAKIYIPP
ncbi:hypothetical protein ATANTOWER_012481 [Ataeniobius toweri]|uniref:Uncharacterized protein n=1 Tax=Ataeniobius toweri TaxID=208326 RepID=A0ABU7AJK5_9TELE|nr:hypothetical protein [Ataeniobius toweri]